MVSNIVIIDSNFVLLPYQFKIDYLTEIRLILQGELKFPERFPEGLWCQDA